MGVPVIVSGGKIINALKSNGHLLKAFYYTGGYFILDALFDKKGVYILCYHRLSDQEPGSAHDPLSVDYRTFEKHLAYLERRYELVGMDQAAELLSRGEKLKKRYAVVTFDDGYRDNYLYGREIFRRYGVKPTIFLTAGKIEERSWLWHDRIEYMVFASEKGDVTIDTAGIRGLFPLHTEEERRRLADALMEAVKRVDESAKNKVLDDLAGALEVRVPEQSRRLLDWDEAGSLAEAGADMGGHTMNHPILSRLPAEEMRREIADCKRLVEERMGKEVRHFAYPNGKPGDYTQESVAELKKLYRTAATTVMGVNLPGGNLYELRRILIGKDADILKFKFKLLQAKISRTLHHAALQG
jgi:peptidoglycan/xylan/chitin deacetylase (PgdA/CDA1 family)